MPSIPPSPRDFAQSSTAGPDVGNYDYESDSWHSDCSSCASSSSSGYSSHTDSSSLAAPVAVDEQFLPRLLALFFAIFHPTEGPKVVYQVPEGSVTSEEVGDRRAKGRQVGDNKGKGNGKGKDKAKVKDKGTDGHDDEDDSTDEDAQGAPRLQQQQQQQPLFDFDTLSDYIIPKAPLCGRLVTCSTQGRTGMQHEPSTRNNNNNKQRSASRPRSKAQRSVGGQGTTSAQQTRDYKVVSHPVLLQNSSRYERNTFIFNLAFVFDGRADVTSYEPVVRKCARSLRGLEESSSFLSSPWSQPRMYGIVEQLFQDLNSYSEAFVSLPDAPHTNYEKNKTSHAASQSPFHRDSTLNSYSMSLSREALPKAHFEAAAARGLSAAADTLFKDARTPPHHEQRRSSAGSSTSMRKGSGSLSVNTDKSPGLTGIDPAGLTSGMSPIEEASGIQSLALGQAQSSGQAAVKRDPSLTMSPISSRSGQQSNPASTELGFASLADCNGADSDLAGGADPAQISAVPGLLSTSNALGLRGPSVGHSKTTSTAAINEAKVSATSSSGNPLQPSPSAVPMEAPRMQRAVSTSSSSNSSRHSTIMTASTENLRPALRSVSKGALSMSRASSNLEVRRHADDSAEQHSIDAIAADLSSSLLSVRQMSGGGEYPGSLHPFLSNPPPRPSGQREPPHGLGRTVTEAINLRLFPTHANPAPVNDWDVPVSLLHLGGKASSDSSNWDLTMARVYPFIDGINHVKRIAQLADADLELTRQCIEHLLYYGCVLMVDVFQFYNRYTLRPTIASLADDRDIQTECGPYVTRPGYAPIQPWSTMLSLYNNLRPETILEDWIEEEKVEQKGIDPRRFVTFGIIKGFLRRVHRYPVLVDGVDALYAPVAASPVDMEARGTAAPNDETLDAGAQNPQRPGNRRQPSDVNSIRTVTEHSHGNQERAPSRQGQRPAEGSSAGRQDRRPRTPVRNTAATVSDGANVAFEYLSGGGGGSGGGDRVRSSPRRAPRLSMSGLPSPRGNTNLGSAITLTPGGLMYPDTPSTARPARKDSQYFSFSFGGGGGGTGGGSTSGFGPGLGFGPGPLTIPAQLPALLDGTHCDDELCVRFGVSWPMLRRMLIQIGRVAAYNASLRRQQQQFHLHLQGQEQSAGNAHSGAGAGASAAAGMSDWPIETPAFMNASGFASGFGAGAASAWHLPTPPIPPPPSPGFAGASHAHARQRTTSHGTAASSSRRHSNPNATQRGASTSNSNSNSNSSSNLRGAYAAGGGGGGGAGGGGGTAGGSSWSYGFGPSGAAPGAPGGSSWSHHAHRGAAGGEAPEWTDWEEESRAEKMEGRGDLGGVLLLTV